MIVQCPECRTKFKLADEKVTPKGVKIRCSSCKHVFVVRRDEAEEEAPPPPAAKGGSSSFSVDDFGTGVDSSDVFSESEFTDGPLGQTRPPDAPNSPRPDRPIRPPAGAAPPPRPAVKPAVQDNVFNIDDVDFSVGRQMGVDIAGDAPPPKPAAPKAKAPTAGDPFSEGKGDFDNLDELFGPKKGAKPAAAPAAPSPPKKKQPPAAGADPFGDSMTLGAEQPPKAGGSAGDPFGDLFDGGAPPTKGKPAGKHAAPAEDSMQSLLTNESEASDHSFMGGGQGPGEGSGDDFNSLISDTDDFFVGNKGGGGGEDGGVQEEDTYDPASVRVDPAIQWGNQKKTQNVAPPSVAPKIIGAVAAVLVLVLGWRGSVEFMPQLYLDGGVDYERLVSMREMVPFVTNSDFPPPPQFWELKISKSFTIVNQFAKELYVVEGEVKNVGKRSRSFFEVEGQAVNAGNKPIGLAERVYAANTLDIEELKREPVAKVRQRLQRKIGADGKNIDIKKGASVPFMLVFPELPEKASNVQILQVQASSSDR